MLGRNNRDVLNRVNFHHEATCPAGERSDRVTRMDGRWQGKWKIAIGHDEFLVFP